MKPFATTHWISKQISYQHYLCQSSIHASTLIAFKLWYSLEHVIKFNSTEVAYCCRRGELYEVCQQLSYELYDEHI